MKEKFDREYELEVLRRRFGIDESEVKQFELHDLHSKYWMGNLPPDSTNLISLASYRKAIANFVRISTLYSGVDKNIKVLFNVANNSFTDIENVVVLSAYIKNEDFDVVVGDALHEANHIIRTDPNVLERIKAYENMMETHDPLPLNSELTDQMNRLKYNEFQVREELFDFFNWIEDIRVDWYGMKESPGYRPYYKAAWNKYFGDKIIGLALKSKYFRDLDMDSYSFRIINITNPHTDLDALPGLRKIDEMLDIDIIRRLENTEVVANYAMTLLTFIYSQFPEPPEQEQQEEDNSDEKNEEEKGNESDEKQEEKESDEQNEDENNEPDSSNEENDENNSSKSGDKEENDENTQVPELPDDMVNIPKEKSKDKKELKENSQNNESKEYPDLTSNQKEELKEIIEQQKKYLSGKLEKESITPEQSRLIDVMDSAETTIEKVQGDNETGMNVMVVRNMTGNVLATLPIGYTGNTYYLTNRYKLKNSTKRNLLSYDNAVKGVNRGIKLGRMLSKKLQVRDESRIYRTKRKTSGIIDRRMLYNLGLNDGSIFEKTQVDKFGTAIVHISVDASGSMNGNEWVETMTAVTAIAYAASKVGNLDVIISFRSIVNLGVDACTGQDDTPLMVIAYDSRKDSFNKIKELFPSIEPVGITPEGLCYEATMKEILSASAGKISYFINFSDGMPNMSNRNKQGMEPVEIAKDAVNKMKKIGIRILSFYIGDGEDALEAFKEMYGKNTREINVTEIIPLAKELNKLFSTEKN